MVGEPGPDLGGFVGGVVVHHQVQFLIGVGAVELTQERQEFQAPMLGLDRCGDLTGRDLQRREQGGGAVAAVVVGAAFDVSGPDRGASGRSGPTPGFGSSRTRGSTIALSGGAR